MPSDGGTFPSYTTDLGPLDRWKENLSYAFRKRIMEIFLKEFRPDPSTRVADFGVSAQHSHPTHTFFEALYPHPASLTAIGREEASWIPGAFPGISYLTADIRSIPLPDHRFDLGFCNAVLEHAGDRESQAAMIREVCRVCRTVMFVTPNRAFPIEVHTFLPFLHWLPPRAFRGILRTLGWKNLCLEANLNLLTGPALLDLLPPQRENRLLRTGIPGLSLQLVAVSAERAHNALP